MTDRKPIGVCAECGQVAYKRRPVRGKHSYQKKDVDSEGRVILCPAHYAQSLRNEAKGVAPGTYTRPHEIVWDEAELRRLYVLRFEQNFSLRQIGALYGRTHAQIVEYAAKAQALVEGPKRRSRKK